MATKRRMLIVGGIILGLIAILSIFLIGAIHILQERARRSQCLGNLKQLGLCMDLYAADHGQARPTSISDFIPYVGGDRPWMSKLFMCPSSVLERKAKMPEYISQFGYNPDFIGYDLLSCTNLDGSAKSIPLDPVLSDRPGNHGNDGINILFRDGHVSWWPGTLSDFARSNKLAITISPWGFD